MGIANDDEEDVLAETDDEIEKRAMAWADPIAEGAIAYAGAEALDLSAFAPEEHRQEMISALVGGIPALFSEGLLSHYFTREMRENGQGRLRFKRGGSGALETWVDGLKDFEGRANLREGYGLVFREQCLPGKLAVWITQAAEEAVLGGKAYFAGFAYDAAASTPEEAVYARAPRAGEIEQAQEQRTQRDQDDAVLERLRVERVERLKALLAKLGDDDRSRLSATAGGIDNDSLEYAHCLIDATFETYLNDARFEEGQAALALRRDGSIAGAQEIPASHVLTRLAEDLDECWRESSRATAPAPIEAAGLIAWTIEAGGLIPDLFERLRCAPDPEGLRVTYARDA